MTGLDDWVPLAAVDGLARQLGAVEEAEVAEASMASMRELTEHHLVESGKVSDGGFFACDDPDDGILVRIANAMHTTDPREWGFSYWMRNTPAGDQLAKTQCR